MSGSLFTTINDLLKKRLVGHGIRAILAKGLI